MRRRAALAAGALVALAFLAPIAASAEEVKVMQGMDLSFYGSEYQGNDDSPFVRLQAPADWVLLPTLYADYTLRFQTQSGVSGQMIASAQGAASTSLTPALDQAWVKASFGDGWAIAFGRRVLEDWKDGSYWNPSDLVNNYLTWGEVGQAPGKDSVELFGLLPLADLDIDLNAATALPASIGSPADLPYYLTAGSILDPLEVRLKAAFQSGRHPCIGAAARWSLQSGEIYADGIWLRDQPIASRFGLGDPTGSWFRYSAGGRWTFDISPSKLAQTLYLQAEYLRQDDGLDASQMSGYFGDLSSLSLPASETSYVAEAGIWNGRFLALGQDYAYCVISIGEIANDHIGLTEGCVLNLDELDFAIASTVSWSPRNLFSISFTATNFGGKAGGESSMLPYQAEYSLCLARSF
jgi:hypothetical protein